MGIGSMERPEEQQKFSIEIGSEQRMEAGAARIKENITPGGLRSLYNCLDRGIQIY
jgi:hypothetical protein